jgi:hypothetical protein
MTSVTGGGNPVDRPRDKRGAFIRLAERRTTAILSRIRILSNLANRSVYEYTEADIEQIFAAIERELDLARAKFTAGSRRRPDFRLTPRGEP